MAFQRSSPSAPISLTGRALRLLSGREHSRAELERKLQPYEPEDAPGALAQVLDSLQAKGFINEQRVVDSVLYRRAAKLGTARIRQELHTKGLDPAMVQEAVARLQDTELTRAREVWRKKFGSPPEDAAARGKQQRFLLARGFSGDVVRKVVAGGDEQDWQ